MSEPAPFELRERGLEKPASFRNVHFESHQARLQALGGSEVPAIWDGTRLHVGEAACLAFLDALAAG
jgi:hypothetical protein